MGRFNSRKINIRKEKKYVLILCAETEQSYFESFLSTRYPNLTIKYKSTGISEIPNKDSYAKHMKKCVNGHSVTYEKIFHVFDLERPIPDGGIQAMLEYIQECKNHQKPKSKRAKKPMGGEYITPVVSMPSIEIWFLLHYLDQVNAYPNAKDCIDKLNTFITMYRKNNTNWDSLNPHLEKAIKRHSGLAQDWGELDGVFKEHGITNPMTEIPKLLQELELLNNS